MHVGGGGVRVRGVEGELFAIIFFVFAEIQDKDAYNNSLWTDISLDLVHRESFSVLNCLFFSPDNLFETVVI